MSTWHVAPSMLQAYAEDRVDVAISFSVEAHLEACESCRHNVANFVDRKRLESMWSRISDAVAEPERGFVERGLMFLGVKDHIARLLAATPSLRLSWLLAIFAVLSIALGTAYGAHNGYVLFLLVAPLLPVAGVAAAYGPGVDPTYEIGLAAPMRSFSLLLIRTVAVVATTIVVAAVAALFLPEIRWAAPVAWLVPALGLSAATLALSTFMRPLSAAGAASTVWLAVAGSAIYRAYEGMATVRDGFSGPVQLLSFVVLLASVVIVGARQGEFEKGVDL